MEEHLKILEEHPFLEGLNPELLIQVSPHASEIQFNAGQIIYREGEEANQFLLIMGGKVSIEVFSPAKGSHVIQTVGPGEILGWSWLFPPYRRRFDARALEITRAIALNGKSLRERADKDPSLGYELFKRFSAVVVERLQAMRLQLIDIYGKSS